MNTPKDSTENKAKTSKKESLTPITAIVDEQQQAGETQPPVEIGGPKGKEPTRYGDWEKNGRCIDF
ncbi:MAG: succinate dehydrogenase assembly factor 4 [Pseudomonadota bacterium]